MLSRVRSARGHLSALRSALLSPTPDAIVECLPGLADAAQCLGAVERELREPGVRHPELSRELQALRNDLGLLHRLLEHGAVFYQGWANLLGTATSGYMLSGEAAPVTAFGSISIRG